MTRAAAAEDRDPDRQRVPPHPRRVGRPLGRGRALSRSRPRPSVSRSRAPAGLDFCSTYCRYCTRSRVVGHGEIAPSESRLEKAFEYLRNATEVRDVLISGGDPLTLSNDRLDVDPPVRSRRFPTSSSSASAPRCPPSLPQRITPDLCRMLRRFHPLWMSVHFLHPDECTPEAARACARLADAGIPLGSPDGAAPGRQRRRRTR